MLTPREAHHVRSHYPTPDLDADGWTVALTGDAETTDLSTEALREEYPTTSVAHTMESAVTERTG